MATSGTPGQGLDYAASKIYVSGVLTFVAYTNIADSLSSTSVYADLTQPTVANGYAPILLDGVFSFNNGIVTYVHSSTQNPRWTASGTWSATVTGAAIVNVTATKLLHFKDLTSAFTAGNLKVLEVDLSTVLS